MWGISLVVVVSAPSLVLFRVIVVAWGRVAGRLTLLRGCPSVAAGLCSLVRVVVLSVVLVILALLPHALRL
eukprot:8312884-Prorocentrum_lima.AAC.1